MKFEKKTHIATKYQINARNMCEKNYDKSLKDKIIG